MPDRGNLTTELRNPRSLHIDTMSTAEAFALINAEDTTLPAAIAKAQGKICAAIDLVVAAFGRGGRLIYVGAGTSGRLGVLDSAECPPTFLSDPNMVQGDIAGGTDALRRSIEGAEDRPEEGGHRMDAFKVGADDVIFGIAAGGTTPYVHGALARAKSRGAKTVFLSCVEFEDVPDQADISIRVLVGPEVITGSTRLKAGTATKMVLNMVTTIAMVQLGKVYQNLMVDVNTQANAKLVDRGTRIVAELTDLNRQAAHDLLVRAEGRVKLALIMHFKRVDFDVAEKLLAEHAGHLARVLRASP